MSFLIIVVILIVFSFLLVRQVDQRRWHRYQFERDLYFRNNPYILKSNEQFDIALMTSKVTQKKLINVFMLKPNEQYIYKKVIILRESQQRQRDAVKVMIGDLTLGYLDDRYAEKLCQSLADTDFLIGRPIEVLAEIFVLVQQQHVAVSQIKLDLPRDPTQVGCHLTDQHCS